MKIEKLSPAFKDYLWGGTKLRDVYGKKCDYEKVAESWELSTHPAGQSVIDGGEYDGLKFGEYLEKVGAKALGVNGAYQVHRCEAAAFRAGAPERRICAARGG